MSVWIRVRLTFILLPVAKEAQGKEKVLIAVDPVILTIREDELQVLLIERSHDPFEGELAFPGGFLLANDHDLDAAAARKLAAETGLDTSDLHMEQLGAYGARDRDPRGRVIAVAYLAIQPSVSDHAPDTAAGRPRWHPVAQLLTGRVPLAFDHRQILSDAVEAARRKLEHTTLATAFCPPRFTMADLRRVYEVVWGLSGLDPRNFHRKVLSTKGFVVATRAKRQLANGRPATLYRRASTRAVTLYPPMLRERY